MLVHTPNGNIPIVARFLQQSGLFLDHPQEQYWDPERIRHFLYLNPHNPPEGGHARHIIGSNRTGNSGPGGSKWNMPSVSGKSVEVQRSQVDEVFKSLRSGDELEETEPSAYLSSVLFSPLIMRKHRFGYCYEVISSPEESAHLSVGTGARDYRPGWQIFISVANEEGYRRTAMCMVQPGYTEGGCLRSARVEGCFAC